MTCAVDGAVGTGDGHAAAVATGVVTSAGAEVISAPPPFFTLAVMETGVELPATAVARPAVLTVTTCGLPEAQVSVVAVRAFDSPSV